MHILICQPIVVICHLRIKSELYKNILKL